MNPSTLLQLFSPPSDPALLSYGAHDPTMVLLSLLVAIFSSWMGLKMAGQAQSAASSTLRYVALLSGSMALGCGVWAMHFIGMLAFNLCTSVLYAPGLTVLSIVPSVAASLVAMSLLSRTRITPWSLAGGGLLVGAGIGAMHYTGMAAMRMSLQLRYDPFMFGLSIVVAVALATLALWVRFGLRRIGGRLNDEVVLLLSASVMGCAIAGMHYTGMAAARFVGQPDLAAGGNTNSTFIALATCLITILFTLIVVGANGWLRYREVFRKLSQSEQSMRAVLTTAVDGVITIDADGIIEEFNAAAERIYGWARHEVIGQSINLLGRHEDGDVARQLRAYLRAHAAERESDRSVEVAGVRKDGTAVPVRCAIGHAKLGERLIFVLFITDLSERRAMLQALRESELQFRSLIGNIPGISYRHSMQGKRPMAFISDAVERVAGYPASDFVGEQPTRRLSDLMFDDERAQLFALVQRAAGDGQPFLAEYRLRHADGSIRWLWGNGAVVFGADGQPLWLDGVILDISERRRNEEELRLAKDAAERAAAARASFVANMSHEIRTPMNSILGFTDVLLDSDLSTEQRRHLDTVRGAGRSLLRLLNEILDTAKLDKGAMELEPGDYNLLALIDELSSTIGAKARGKGLAIDIGYDAALPAELHGDELRVRQILTNLLDNAIKFTAAGKVSLLARVEQGQLHILVQDTGIGIAPERLGAIFDPFTQADPSMTRRFGGTGLGTTISKQLVDLMGGRIWVESQPGHGSTFHVQLPLVPAHQPVQLAGARHPYALPPLRVLAADDVAQNLELLGLLLGKRGHTLQTAADGAEAVRLASAGQFDLVLMDVQMPLMDGLAATVAIRATEQRDGRTRVPVVAMTASVLDAHRDASRAAGMDGFASKPVDWYALSHEIARVLGLEDISVPLTPQAKSGQRVLNRKAGLARWDGSEDAYRQALQRFESVYSGETGHRLTLLVQATDYAAAQAKAHKIRGVAANLGMEQLAHALSQLELLCATGGGDDATVLSAALGEAVAQLQAALAAVRALPAPAAPEAAAAMTLDAPAAAPFDAATARAAGQALLLSLQRGALDDAALTALATCLGNHAASAAIDKIGAALADFDFPLAQSTLETLLGTLALEPT